MADLTVDGGVGVVAHLALGLHRKRARPNIRASREPNADPRFRSEQGQDLLLSFQRGVQPGSQAPPGKLRACTPTGHAGSRRVARAFARGAGLPPGASSVLGVTGIEGSLLSFFLFFVLGGKGPPQEISLSVFAHGIRRMAGRWKGGRGW
jgi:hypothetical protein